MRRFTHSLVVRFVVGLILAVLFVFPSSSASADTGVWNEDSATRYSNHWATYHDARYDFSVEYPSNWKILSRKDKAAGYGEVLVFELPQSSQQGIVPTQIVIGLHTIERDTEQDLVSWVKEYLKTSSVFSPSEVDIEEIRAFTLHDMPAVYVKRRSPLGVFQFVNIAYGKTVWFVWTNTEDESSTTIFWRMVRSFSLHENTPTTLREAFGTSFQPLPRRVEDDIPSTAPTMSTMSIEAPSTWRVPTPPGKTYPVNCGSRAHTGHAYFATDIALPEGTPVYAAHLGWVDFAGWNADGYGNLIKISTDRIYSRVYTSYYAHLRSFAVSPGLYVGTTGRIASSGNTGNTTGPHLHFHTRNASESVNLSPIHVFDENHRYPSGHGKCGEMHR